MALLHKALTEDSTAILGFEKTSFEVLKLQIRVWTDYLVERLLYCFFFLEVEDLLL